MLCHRQYQPKNCLLQQVKINPTAVFRFNSLDAVEDTLVESLVSLENDKSRVQSLTGFNWIVNNVLIAT